MKIRSAMWAAMTMGVVIQGTGMAGDLWVGARGGINFPKLRGGDDDLTRGYETFAAPNVGVAAEYSFHPNWSVVLEAVYNIQGGERDELQPITVSAPGLPDLPPGQFFWADFKNKSELEYLEFPLMLRARWLLGSGWAVYAEAGGYLGFLLSAEQKTRGTSPIYLDKSRTPLMIGGRPLPTISLDADTDVKENLNDVNWGVTGGVGVEYRWAERHSVYLDVRGQYGVREVQEDTEHNGEANTGFLAVLLGYQIRL